METAQRQRHKLLEMSIDDDDEYHYCTFICEIVEANG